MSLEAILEKIRQSARDQIVQIEARCGEEVERLLIEAGDQAARLQDEAFRRAVTPAAGEQARLLHAAHLEASNLLGQAADEFASAVLQQVHSELSNVRDHPSYENRFRRLAVEALDDLVGSLDEDELVIMRVDPRDKGLALKLAHAQSMQIQVEGSIATWGGVIVEGSHTPVVVINTLEERLAQARSYLHQCLGSILLGDEKERESDQVPLSA